METTIEKLNELYERESQLNEEIMELRKQQVKLCKKELLGKCFKIKERDTDFPTKEEYWKWICFTGLTLKSKWDGTYFLTAVVVELGSIKGEQSFGVQVGEQSDATSEWLEWLEDAEETTSVDFRNARHRAHKYLCELVDEVKEEE